jgi:RNA polymerase sigma factor (sigma-70 family)
VPKQKPDHSRQTEVSVSVLAEYAPRLHRLLRRRFAHNGADLEDLMQEIWKAWVARPPNIVVEDPAKYLFGIAWRVGCRHLAAKVREPLDHRAEATPKSVAPASIEAAESDAVNHDLVRQIRKLPRAYQEVLKLKMETDLSNRQIAEELQLSEATVKKYYVKAMAQLRMGGP